MGWPRHPPQGARAAARSSSNQSSGDLALMTLRRARTGRPARGRQIKGGGQRRRRAGDIEGVHSDGVVQAVPRPGLVAQDQDPVPLVDQRALFGHQIEAVPDGVDQGDVGTAEGGHRARVVVL